jgi:hypothetical protein
VADPFAEDLAEEDEALYDLSDAPDVPVLPELTGDLNDDLPEALMADWQDVSEAEAAQDGAEQEDDGPEAALMAALTADDPAVEETASGAEPLAAGQDDEATAEGDEAFEAEAEEAQAPVAEPQAADGLADLVRDSGLQVDPEAPVAKADDAGETAPAPAAAAAVVEKAQRARARIIKIRRADALPPATGAAEAASGGPTEDGTAGLVSARGDVGDRDQDMARLLRQADDEMLEPENRRRLEAIQHLKAAVAATVAERRAGVKEPSDEERSDPYRADLARAVRPVRPRAAEGSRVAARPALPVSEAPVESPVAEQAEAVAEPSRPAPLVLVSEQRIDRAPLAANPALVSTMRPGSVAPVRPRRLGGGAATAAVASGVGLDSDPDLEAELQAMMAAGGADAVKPAEAGPAPDAWSSVDADDRDEDRFAEEDAADPEDAAAEGADTDNIFADSRGFAEFADRLGATALPDLLEAAAAYATCVENRDRFTRPFLMRRLEAGHMGEGFTREDGLRGFGTLLRDGKIEKTGRGHFVLSERSSYLAEARKMAQ